MYYGNQQNQGLPFNPQGFDSPPRQFAPNQPPVQVGNLAIPPALQYVVPYAAAAFANDVSGKSSVHGGRVFLYNQVSVNNYQNQDFQNGVALTMDLICLGLVKGSFRQPEDGLASCAAQAANIMSGSNYQRFPALQSYVSNESWIAGNKINYELGTLNAEIQGAKQRLSMPAGYPQQGNFNQPQQGWQGGGVAGGMGGGQQFPVSNTGRAVYGGSGNPGAILGGAGSVLFGSQAQPSVGAALGADNSVQADTRYAYLNKAPLALAPQQTGQLPQQAQQPTVEDTPDAKWIASMNQPTIPAPNPFLNKIALQQVLERTAAGYGKKAQYVLTDLTEEEMERNAHAIGPIWDAVLTPIPVDQERAQKFITKLNDLRSTENALAGPAISTNTPGGMRVPEEDMPAPFEDTLYIGHNFLDSAIFEGRVKATENGQNGPCDVYRQKVFLAAPFITNVNQGFSGKHRYGEVLENISKCKSFREIVMLMGSHIESRDKLGSKFFTIVDRIFTQEVNNILKYKLSINTKIGSFYSDVNDLFQYLEEKYGEAFSNALRTAERGFSDRYLSTYFSLEEQYEMFEANVEGREDKVIIDYIPQTVSLTYVNVLAKELDFAIVGDNGVSVTRTNNPVIHGIVADIFKFEEYSKVLFAHQYIVTLDDTVFEVHQGLIGHSFIVSKYK